MAPPTPVSQLHEPGVVHRRADFVPQAAMNLRPGIALPELPLWLVMGSVLLSMGWLLPNHYPPWSTFHMDAWVASVLLLAAAAVVVAFPGRFAWRGLSAVSAALALLPGLQWAGGLISLSGTAWIVTAYVGGFMLATMIGAHWEANRPAQALDALFLAIGIAAIASVGLQLCQWLFLALESPWILADNYNRPFANFGQPNQLATFLVWGLLALGWALRRRQVRPVVALGSALFLLFGLALTASRASWIAIALVVAGSWYWRRLWPYRRYPLAVTALAAAFAGFVMSVTVLQQYLLGGIPSLPQELTRIAITGENRPAIWIMFLDAAWQRPWIGYGWNQVAEAQLAVALRHTPKFGVFGQAHNLALDLVLWCGLPLGLAVTVWVGWWFWRRLQTIASPENALLMLFLLVALNHAMLELPLHHAYFLLPVGLVAGVLDVRVGVRALYSSAHWVMLVLWLVAAAMLSLIVLDYARMEPQYQQLRYEWNHIEGPRAQPPDAALMNQFPEFVRLVQFEPKAGMDAGSLKWLRALTQLYPRPATLLKLAQALALNGQPDEAAHWLRTVCQVAVAAQCEAVRREWVERARHDPLLAAVPWPAS